jgi:hypothetical protein
MDLDNFLFLTIFRTIKSVRLRRRPANANVCNQVVRLDDAPCQFHGKIFTLPTYLEVFSTQAISCLSFVFGTLLSSRKSAAKSPNCFFRLPEMTRILNRLPVRVSVEMSQPNIQTNSFTRWFSFQDSLNIKAKLNVVPISATNNPNPLNLLQLIEMQITSSPQLKTSRFETIGESDSSSIFRKLPSTGFVFYRTICLMLFKTWETLLRCFFLTVVVEPSDSLPLRVQQKLDEP